jgi:SAM-dependent methyltransferase
VRREFLDLVRCPSCGEDRPFDLNAAVEDDHEVREGAIVCRSCGERRSISRGIVDLMPEVPEYVRREAAGLERFAKDMRVNGWTKDRLLKLPYEQTGYWYTQATAMHQTLANDRLDLQPGNRILDVGSNTCWASATFAERQMEPVALDITSVELQGLASADWWFEGKGVYFERVLGVMFDLPFASETFDHVWCCEVLHHNDRSNLRRTLEEMFRILRPGGRLIVVNEPVRALRSPKLRPGADVAEYEGHEHAYFRWTYRRAVQNAGFDVELVGPWLHPLFTPAEFKLVPDTTALEGFRSALRHALRRSARLRAAALGWKNYITGTSTYLIGTRRTSG